MSCGAGKGTCRGDVHGCDAGSDVNSKIITIKIKSSKNQKRESKAANQMQMCASVQVCECVAQGLGIVAKEIMAGLFLLLVRAATAAAATLRCAAAAVLILCLRLLHIKGQLAAGKRQLATGNWQLARGKW